MYWVSLISLREILRRVGCSPLRAVEKIPAFRPALPLRSRGLWEAGGKQHSGRGIRLGPASGKSTRCRLRIPSRPIVSSASWWVRQPVPAGDCQDRMFHAAVSWCAFPFRLEQFSSQLINSSQKPAVHPVTLGRAVVDVISRARFLEFEACFGVACAHFSEGSNVESHGFPLLVVDVT
jgi:hypothetical protein